MKTTNIIRVLTICVCGLTLALGTAHAVEVSHNGNPIFVDGFEGISLGGSPDAGLWEVLFAEYGGALTVVDDAIPGPGHLEGVGTQYVKIVGDANPPPEGGPYLTMEADLGSINSGTIHAEFMMYIEGNGIGGTQGLRTSGTAATREPRISTSWKRDTEDPQDGEVNAYNDGFGYADLDMLAISSGPGVPIIRNQWQKWEFDFNFKMMDDGSDDTFRVTVDDIQSGEMPIWRAYPDVGSIVFGMSAGFVDTYYVDAVSEVPPAPPATVFTWEPDDVGNWADASSWSFDGSQPSQIADNQEHTAIFGSAISTNTTAVTNVAVTLNRIEFDNGTHSYNIAGIGSVSLAESTAMAIPRIDVVQGHHQFQAQLDLIDDTTVEIAQDASLTLNNALNLGGKTLTKVGEGTLGINNRVGSGGGTIDCLVGTCSGNGTVGGNLNNSGATVAPGDSPGILTVDGNYTQNAGGTLALEIGGLTPGEQHDKLVVMGTADLNGTVAVELISSFSPTTNDEFDVLDFASFVDSGYTFDFSQAGVAGDWDTSLFESLGTLCFGSCTGTPVFTDFDDSGSWDLPDLNLVLFNWQQDEASLPPEWVRQRPATVGLESLNMVLFNWQQPSSLAVVPEPAGLALVLVGVFGVAICRHRA